MIWYINYRMPGSKIQTTGTRRLKREAVAYGTSLLRQGYIVNLKKGRGRLQST